MPRIKVSEKALAHLSRGLYRSPASALKELVSNAWDANAKTVTISTNYPNFLQVSCTDDGDGFTKEAFNALMQGGIGNSTKRSESKPLINDRPTIGRLGIGMLAIAQICGSYQITSRPRKGRPFRARVRLYDLLKEKLDKEEATVVQRSQASLPSEGIDAPMKEVDIGEFEFVDLEAESLSIGTAIIADDVHPTFAHAFKQAVNRNNSVEPNLDWAKTIKPFYSVATIRELGDYWKLLWELSAACPIPYLSGNVLPDGVIKEEHKKLLSYDFTVVVDGISLRKPVYLKGNKNGYTVVKFPLQERKIYGKRLCFDGYLVVQEGLEIKPAELRGILIRIKNIAIGYYDSTLLDYRINEGPRSRWLTGEVFVREGLEDALNIDRDSFNQFHPEFRAVQEFVHEQLQKELFKEVYKKIEHRSAFRARQKSAGRSKTSRESLASKYGKPVSFRTGRRAQKEGDLPSVEVKEGSRKVEVIIPPYSDLRVKKSNQQLAISILAIFETAMQDRTPEQRRETFTKLLFDLLNKW